VKVNHLNLKPTPAPPSPSAELRSTACALRSLVHCSSAHKVFWDATVAARLPGGDLVLHFADGDKCTVPGPDADADAGTVHRKRPVMVRAAHATGSDSSSSSSSSSSLSGGAVEVLAAGSFYGANVVYPKWYAATCLPPPAPHRGPHWGGASRAAGRLVEACRRLYRSGGEGSDGDGGGSGAAEPFGGRLFLGEYSPDGGGGWENGRGIDVALEVRGGGCRRLY